MRNGRLWTTHQMQVDDSGVAGSGGRNGVRWYELQNLGATPSVVQSGTVFDPAAANPASFWFGAIMPSGQGHVALGMSAAGPLTPVNGAVTGRLAGDPLGTMNGSPVVYSPNTSFSYNVQTSPDTPAAVGRLFVHERRPRRRHDAVDACRSTWTPTTRTACVSCACWRRRRRRWPRCHPTGSPPA